MANEIILQNSLRNNQDFYPIIITFKDIENNNFDIEESVIQYFKREWNDDLSIDGLKILQTESCALFIDALDELAKVESKEKALNALKDFNSKYPNIKIVSSSRPSDYLFNNCETLGFRYLELEQLNTRQIEMFFNSYFSDNLLKSKSLLKSLRDSAILDKLPKTPLTLALITILFDENEVEIPSTITDLYENFVNLLLGKITASHTVDILESNVKHRLLCYIAKYLHTELIYKTDRKDLVRIIKEYSEERGQTFDVENITNELIEHSGLLYINEKHEISFKHLSFQEYFTAYEIFHHRQSDRNIFIENFNDLWWQNVAIFYAGMSKDAPLLLEQIIDKSIPKNLQELITNTGGIGKILQALYNTPIEVRKKGILRGVENTLKSLDYILNNNNDETEFWKNFSKYALMQIFGGWFTHHNWSVTLTEPLNQQFYELLPFLEKDLAPETQFEIEFSLLLFTSILASDDYGRYEVLKDFVEKAKLTDLEILASVDTQLKLLYKYDKNAKEDVNLKKVNKKIKKKILSIPGFSEIVNQPIGKNDNVEQIEEKNE